MAATGGGSPTRADFHQAISARGDRWYSVCLRITQSPTLAEDAVQDALLNAWRMRHQFAAGARLDTWIHRIAVNAALQLLRKNKPNRMATLEVDTLISEETPEQDQVNLQLGMNLATALRGLTEVERLCFVLKHLEQWRIKEIADELAVTEGSVKQALFRGVHKLRSTMPNPRGQEE